MNPGSDSPERDPALERAWRAHSREAPPPELDRAILAAAHRAVGSGPQDAAKGAAEAALESTRPQRWWMPLAAAAAIGVIAIGILQLTSPEQSLVAPNERVAAVARRGADEQVPAPAVRQNADDAMKERDAASLGRRNDIAGVTQKKKQEAQPAVPAPVPSPPPPAAPIGRENQVAPAKPAFRAPEPQPFPATTDTSKNASAEMKRAAPDGGAAKASDARPPTAAPQTPPATMAEERAASRKDAAGERQQLAAATDKTTASAQPGRSGPASEGAVSSFASAPTPPVASPRARAGGLARNEAPAQAAPAASPPPVLGKTMASPEELRAKARDPDAWIVRIRKLRDEGNTAEALRELREFRNVVQDAERRLPADLLAWANTFKP